MDPFEAELHAIALRSSRDFRVMRRLGRRLFYERQISPKMKTGVIVDLRTTGSNPQTDEIIEIGMVRFAYTPGGVILGPTGDFHAFNKPLRPIPADVVRMTGITDALVDRLRIKRDDVSAFIASADIVIMHDAGTGRPFCERLCPDFVHKPWACSQSQIPWAREGFEGTKLFYIAYHYHFYFEGHRTTDDVYALLEILEQPLPRSTVTALAALLDAARRKTFRIYALGAPFDVKDRLKARGYRWGTGEDGKPRAWHREVEGEHIAAEIDFLDSLGWPDLIEPLVLEVDAYLRFSDRHT